MIQGNITLGQKVEYNTTKHNYLDWHVITIEKEDGTKTSYAGKASSLGLKTEENAFPKLIYDCMTKYSTENDPNITPEEAYKLIEDITIGCLTDPDNDAYATGSSDKTGRYSLGTLAGKNSYIEAFKGMMDLYSNEEFSENGRDITVNEQIKIIETFAKADWEEIETDDVATATNNNTVDSSNENNTKENKGIFGWLKNFFGINN